MKAVFMKAILLILSFSVGYSVADTLDEQIAQANKAADSLRVVANKLGSQKAATVIDSLYQADLTLAANKVRVVGSGLDSMWVKIALDKIAPDSYKAVRYALKDANLDFQIASSPDTLYMRRDRAEKALPVISAALKE